MERIKLFSNIPVLQKLRYKIGDTTILMKRDDLLNFGFGGNKVRLFEYIAADIIRAKAEKIITFGSVHSNHIRVAANVAAVLGLACDLIILSDSNGVPVSKTPNLKLTEYCGKISVHYCNTEEAHDYIDEYLSQQNQQGIHYYWIPGGGHTATAAKGYLDAAQEIISQLNGTRADAIFVPCGTGTTQAGLIAGLNGQIPVYGITVARDSNRCEAEILSLLQQMKSELTDETKVKVLPCDIRYGEVNQDIRNIIQSLVKSDGIFLEPIYNAKSFLKMSQFVSEKKNMKQIIYINTGGSPNLFI